MRGIGSQMRSQGSSKGRTTCLIAACVLATAPVALAQPSANSLAPGIQPYAPRAAANGGTVSGSPPVARPTATQAVDVPSSGSSRADAAAARTLVHAAPDYDYTLGPGDKLRITVFGEDNLSGEFTIAGNGATVFPSHRGHRRGWAHRRCGGTGDHLEVEGRVHKGPACQR